MVKFQRWKDKTKIFYKRKILPATNSIEEDLTPKQLYDKSKLEAYAKMVSLNYTACKTRSGTLHSWSRVYRGEQVPIDSSISPCVHTELHGSTRYKLEYELQYNSLQPTQPFRFFYYFYAWFTVLCQKPICLLSTCKLKGGKSIIFFR